LTKSEGVKNKKIYSGNYIMRITVLRTMFLQVENKDEDGCLLGCSAV
jgi:hypothetical protein